MNWQSWNSIIVVLTLASPLGCATSGSKNLGNAEVPSPLSRPLETRIDWGSDLFFHPSNKATASAMMNPLTETGQALRSAVTQGENICRTQTLAPPLELPRMVFVALCARFSRERIQSNCTQQIMESIEAWVTTYHATGNPINESQLFPILLSIDLTLPMMKNTLRTKTMAWVGELIRAGDQFRQAQGPMDRINHQETWSLANRAIASLVLQSEPEIESTQAQIQALIFLNLDRSDGSSVDSHVHNLEAWVRIATFAPGMLNPEGRAKVLRALEFLRPFFLGDDRPIEFLQKPWEPTRARPLLRLARAVFPEIRPWTKSIVDENYDALLKLRVALQSEERIPVAETPFIEPTSPPDLAPDLDLLPSGLVQ